MTQDIHDLDLSDKVAVVTGASSGIGAATARAMADAGAQLVVTGRDLERLSSCAEAVRGAGRECIEVAVDLTASDGAEAVVSGAVDEFGRIDCLVNSAGVFDLQPFLETPLEELDRQYAINVRAPYALTKAAVPHMQPGSTVVFVGSNLAGASQPGAAPYAAAKGAVHSLARTLAVELAPLGVRINTVAPGMTRTPMTWRLAEDPKIEAGAIEQTPAGDLGSASDIATAVVYLASDASRYVLGSVLTIDGGWSER